MTLERELAAVVGEKRVLTDPGDMAPYLSDWTGRFPGAARSVVVPATAEETAAIVRTCAAAGTAVVPQGGNTGLVGGSAAPEGSVVVSLSRLQQLEPVEDTGRVVAGAGVTLEKLGEHARAAGWSFPLDHAGRSRATVGGTIATDAGGSLTWRFGSARDSVLGVQAVLANGQLVNDMPPVTKTNTGYELQGLFAGSEGTLGVITSARLALTPLLQHRVVAMTGISGMDAAVDLFENLSRSQDPLHAFEFLSRECLQLVCEHTGWPLPLRPDHPFYLLVEFAGRADPTQELQKALSNVTGLGEAAVSQDDRQRDQLWQYRERMNEALGARGAAKKMDIGVPLDNLGRFFDELPKALSEISSGTKVFAFGHAGDGNIHLNVVGKDLPEKSVDEVVYELVIRLGGTISAEHGIGRAKKDWLSLVRAPAEIDAMKAIKKALDPNELMNPGALLP